MIESGDADTARSALLSLVSMIYDAGMVISIRNPGRLAGDWIEINCDRIKEAEIDVD